MIKPNLQTIFEVLGNKTRRDILTNLSSEPMYFNQLAKKVGIGQQAILRHMKTLENAGFVQVYDEKSDLGAPDRKFYRLNSSFILSVSSSKDEFTISCNSLDSKNNKQATNLQNKMDSIKKSGATLDFIHGNLAEIEKEIFDLETRLQKLRESRQVLLHETNKIGKSDFNRIERKVLYNLMTEKKSSVSSISNRVHENNTDVRDALDQINAQLESGHMSKRAGDLLA